MEVEDPITSLVQGVRPKPGLGNARAPDPSPAPAVTTTSAVTPGDRLGGGGWEWLRGTP